MLVELVISLIITMDCYYNAVIVWGPRLCLKELFGLPCHSVESERWWSCCMSGLGCWLTFAACLCSTEAVDYPFALWGLGLGGCCFGSSFWWFLLWRLVVFFPLTWDFGWLHAGRPDRRCFIYSSRLEGPLVSCLEPATYGSLASWQSHHSLWSQAS